MTCITSILVNPAILVLWEGEEYEDISVTISPENATCKTISWYSDNPEVASVMHDTGYIFANSRGVANIYALSSDGSGVRGVCHVTVKDYYPVTSVVVEPSSKTLEVNETIDLDVTVSPVYATDPTVTWRSLNESRATVDSNGKVTAIKGGTATIEAKSHNGKRGTCTITVNSKPKVIVARDTTASNNGKDFFNINFPDGKVWKSIGLDLTNRRENYDTPYTLPPLEEWAYASLIVEEQRYLDNCKTAENTGQFSVNQLAYIYLFDPLGIEYYMKNQLGDSRDDLLFKDDVYEAIFGTSERSRGKFFFIVEDGKPNYQSNFTDGRQNIHSNAEVLFGSHKINYFDLSDLIFSFLEGLFGLIEDIPIIGHTIQTYQLLFHAAGILGETSGDARSFAIDYMNGMKGPTENFYDEDYGIDFLDKCKNSIKWAEVLTNLIVRPVLDAIKVSNPKGIKIYNKISSEPNYWTVFQGFDGEISMEDIINRVNQD